VAKDEQVTRPEPTARSGTRKLEEHPTYQQPFADLPVRAGWLDTEAIFAKRNLEADRKQERHEEETTITSVVEWSGKWNEDDMQEVIHKLRKLR